MVIIFVPLQRVLFLIKVTMERYKAVLHHIKTTTLLLGKGNYFILLLKFCLEISRYFFPHITTHRSIRGGQESEQ